jgi:hypothetical protein
MKHGRCRSRQLADFGSCADPLTGFEHTIKSDCLAGTWHSTQKTISNNPFTTAPVSFLVKSYHGRQSAHQTKPSLASIVPDQGVAPPTFQ